MKKRAKQIISVLMIVVLCLTGSWITAFSQEMSEKMTVQVVSTTGTPGDDVQVKIELSNNPGISSLKFNVAYDSVLTLKNVEFSEDFGAYVTAAQPYTNPQAISLMSPLKDIKTEGTLATLTFRISEDAKDDYTADISVTCDEKNTFNSAFDKVDVRADDGFVKISKGIPGDVNNDKSVDNKDAILLFRYVADWDVEVVYRALDVNGDQSIDNKDAIILFRYVAEWPGITLTIGADCEHKNLTEVTRKEPTCTEDGNIAYWRCDDCKQRFDSQNATQTVAFDDTVLPMTNHIGTIVIDPAVAPTKDKDGLTEGSHCTKCGAVIVPQKPVNYNDNVIIYHLVDNDQYLASQSMNIVNPNPFEYTSEGLTLRNIQENCVPGYTFVGWFDGWGESAEQIKTIPANSKGAIDLYAHWTKVEYTVRFDSDLVQVDDLKYTTDKGVTLPRPQLDGYIFVGWSDGDGIIHKSVSVGNVGMKTYMANWLAERNKAWTKRSLDAPMIVEDEETDTILFTYEIGQIENVPLYTIEDFGFINSEGVARTISKTYTVKTDEELMKQYATNVAKATTNSSQWSLSSGWNDSVTVSENYLKENNLSETDVNTICKTDSDNWLVSKGSSGSTTKTKYDSSQDYDLDTDTGNTKTYDTQNGSTTHKQSAELNAKYKSSMNVGIDVGVDISASKEFEISGSLGYEGSNTTAYKTGTESDEGHNDQTGSIKHTGRDTVTTGGWNNTYSYGGSKSVSETNSVSKTVSERIASEYGYGRSYIKSGSESSTQGLSTSSSTSNAYSSAVTYNTEETVTETVSYTTSNTKTGYHRLVKAGTAHVFAVVGYDIESAAYFVSTYTVMDDKTSTFEDYSYSSANYDDNQTGVISFEVPYEVEEYVLSKVGETDGLEVSAAGVITGYNGNEKTVIIPEYHVIKNLDGTKNVVKITGISSDAFSGNTEITGIELSDYITEIPDNAFKGCTNLSLVKMSGVTSIGDNAFANCPQIDYIFLSEKITELGSNAFDNMKCVIACASNKDVVNGAISCDTKKLAILISDKCTNLNNTTLTIPETTEYFVFNGYGREFNDLQIISNAEKTTINRASFVSSNKIPLEISSTDVSINQINISAPGITLALTADECNLGLYGESTLSSSVGKTVLCKAANVSQIKNDLTTKMHVFGNVLSFDNNKTIDLYKNTLLDINDGDIIYISKEEFNKYLGGVATVYFDANGGKVSESEKKVYFGQKYGELPEPTKEFYEFVGWYTDAEAGDRITSDSIFNTTEDKTLYAHWSLQSFTVSFDANGGSVSTTSFRASCNNPLGTLPIPTKEFYSFDGWYTQAEGGTKVTESSVYTVPVDFTLYAHWTPKQYTYSIVYKSTNGTNLGSSTVTKAYGTTNNISAPAKSGYNTPSSQNVVWDSSSKTITFLYSPVGVSTSQRVQTNGVWYPTGVNDIIFYDVDLQYQNRTANSVQIRVVWTNKILSGYKYSYFQAFNVSGISGIDVYYCNGLPDCQIVGTGEWGSVASWERSKTACSQWFTIPVSSNATTLSVYGVYWRDGQNYAPGYTYYINIPAY